jgi:hypothetical protein
MSFQLLHNKVPLTRRRFAATASPARGEAGKEMVGWGERSEPQHVDE